MRKWFGNFFGSTAPAAPVVASAPAPPAAPTPRQRSAPDVEGQSPLQPDDVAFLEGLIAPAEPKHLDDFSRSDRLFLGGIVRRLHARQLDLPVFAEAAVHVSALLRESDIPIGRYVALLTGDPALSLEVLKVANSAFYGAATRTTSLHEAIVRIGLTRLESILLMAHLKARVLKGRSQRKAELLLDLSLPTAVLASRFVPHRAGTADLRFMRGMLMHVEHLVILGTIADISREHRAVIAPSNEALHQAFVQSGPDILQAVAAAWKLQDLLLDAAHDADTSRMYTGLREALVCRWLDHPLPPVKGVDPGRLADAIGRIRPRVRAGGEALSA